MTILGVCSICGQHIDAGDLMAADDDGAPAHEWCVEDLRNQEEESENEE